MIRRIGPTDIELVQPLFNAYREFYKCEPAPERARAFLLENLRLERSIIFVAYLESDNQTGESPIGASPAGKIPIGFTQLYPRISSLSMTSYMYISDLFVDPAVRKQGIARKLMQEAAEFSLSTGAKSIQLETAHTNTAAQKLYESLGYVHDTEYRTYYLNLQQSP